MSKHGQLVLRRLPQTLRAEDYNRVRLALLRLGSPLHIALTDLASAQMELGREEWLCLDRRYGQSPLVAWTGFQDAGRSALDAPVPCTVELYHAHAGMLMGSILRALGAELDSLLKRS